VETRKCYGCKKEFLLTSEYFYKKGAGFQYSCKNCAKEYARNIAPKYPPKMEGSKECMYCNKIKDIKEFVIHKEHKDGREGRCKNCKIYIHIKHSYFNLDKQLTTKDQVFLARQIIQKYLIIQYNSCDICKIEFEHENWRVDHCHEKGHMRGLLCHRCNVGLGFIEDATFVKNAKRYLQKDRSKNV